MGQVCRGFAGHSDLKCLWVWVDLLSSQQDRDSNNAHNDERRQRQVGRSVVVRGEGGCNYWQGHRSAKKAEAEGSCLN